MFLLGVRPRMYWPKVLVASPGMVTISRPFSTPPMVMRDTRVRAAGVNCGRLTIPALTSGPMPGICSAGNIRKS